MKQNEMTQAAERATKLETTIMSSANIITATIITNTVALLAWLAC